MQPTYFPAKHPQRGKVSPKTMTFIYGAVEVPGTEPVYGWMSKEALEPMDKKTTAATRPGAPPRTNRR